MPKLANRSIRAVKIRADIGVSNRTIWLFEFEICPFISTVEISVYTLP